MVNETESALLRGFHKMKSVQPPHMLPGLQMIPNLNFKLLPIANLPIQTSGMIYIFSKVPQIANLLEI